MNQLPLNGLDTPNDSEKPREPKQTGKRKNKGQWSEEYVFLQLAGSGKLISVNNDLIPNNVKTPILVIYTANFDYVLHNSSNKSLPEDKTIKIFNREGIEIDSIAAIEFTEYAYQILSEIKNARPIGKDRTFPMTDEVQSFLDRVRYKGSSKKKSDIFFLVHDALSGQQPKLGFSIKSYLGKPPTLFNSSGATNLRFRIQGNLDENTIEAMNAVKGPITRVRNLLEIEGIKLVFDASNQSTFINNLTVIDTKLPSLLCEMLIEYYKGTSTSLVEITNLMIKNDPLRIGKVAKAYYEYKIKNMLTDMALGMQADEPWEGVYNATGGYILVTQTGEVLCFHIYNRNEFQDILFHSTKFDTPDDRIGYADIKPTPNKEFYIDLNFQIRFKNPKA